MTIPIIIPTMDEGLSERIADQLNACEPGVDIEIALMHDPIGQGFTRVVNEGLRRVLESSAPVIGIMSDDCEPRTDQWLAKLLDALDDDTCNGFAAPLMPCRTEGIMGIEPVDEPMVIEHWGVPYGCVLIRRDVFRDVGLLDPFFDHYCSDTDHQFRARRFGWRSVVAWHVYMHRDSHPPREPLWTQDQSKLQRRWG